MIKGIKKFEFLRWDNMKFKKTKICLTIIVIIVGGGLFTATKGLKEGKNVEINNVDMSKLADGTYSGQYSKGRWNSEVEVTVKDNKIEDIKLLSEPLTPDVSKELSKEIIEKQKVKVDVVSGATVSSKAYLKSVENALK